MKAKASVIYTMEVDEKEFVELLNGIELRITQCAKKELEAAEKGWLEDRVTWDEALKRARKVLLILEDVRCTYPDTA